MNRLPLDLALLTKRTLGNAVLRDDLLRLFREHGPPTLSDLTRAVENRDAAAVIAATHRLKGSAATIAAVSLADLARDIEASAAAGEWSKIQTDLVAMRDELQLCMQQIETLTPG